MKINTNVNTELGLVSSDISFSQNWQCNTSWSEELEAAVLAEC